ncbi:MAG TPA: bifunctional precorrin-2 dehydrogenase/sirohydrochlorin ferrochelatase [Saprospiraceae bacterium]|nr:bifunctional precorrin-2 dehydrogenase/sirohydrochlorin ferrochelatase [Saprospiraceae bacterium]
MTDSQNTLFPVFLKVSQLKLLVIGGGEVALEKLGFLYKSSPDARATLVAPEILPEIHFLAQSFSLEIINDTYRPSFLQGMDLVLAATNNQELNRQIYRDARSLNLLINVADTPEICDFYLGGIVSKGHLKISISTNGKSPTMAKRIRQLLEDIFPDDIHDLLNHLYKYRKSLKMEFKQKVEHLNTLTKKWMEEV